MAAKRAAAGEEAVSFPILDLSAPGLELTSDENGVQFDVNADGAADQMAWTAAKTASWRSMSMVDGNGTINHGSEIFSPFFAGGSHAGSLAALSTLDDNGDAVIDSGDASTSAHGGARSRSSYMAARSPV